MYTMVASSNYKAIKQIRLGSHAHRGIKQDTEEGWTEEMIRCLLT